MERGEEKIIHRNTSRGEEKKERSYYSDLCPLAVMGDPMARGRLKEKRKKIGSRNLLLFDSSNDRNVHRAVIQGSSEDIGDQDIYYVG